MIIRKTANFTDVKLNSLKQCHNASAYTWARKQRTFDVAPFDRTNSSWKAFIDTNTTRIVILPVCCKYNNVGLNQSSKKTKSSKNRRIGLKTIYSPNDHPRIPTFQTGAEKGEGRGRREKRLKRRNRVFNSLVFQLPATGREREEKNVREVGAVIISRKKIETLAIPFPLSGYPLPPSLSSSNLDEARLIRVERARKTKVGGYGPSTCYAPNQIHDS